MTSQVILIGSDALGQGDPKLGRLLLGNFLRLLCDRKDMPSHIILWNGGVKAAAKDAETLFHLKDLEGKGVEIILCRTCVEYFGLEQQIGVGKIDGMVRIQEILLGSNVLMV